MDVVEGHGTGTRLGDPIEAAGAAGHLRPGPGTGRPLWLGSVKSNIGHTQAAAGVAGVIKMVLALQHGCCPPTLHVDEPSREVDWSAGQVELLRAQQPWPARGTASRRAGVSSFGISGTNAHVVLEQAPAGLAGEVASATPENPSLTGPAGTSPAGSSPADSAGVSLADGAAAGGVAGGVVPAVAWVVSGKSEAGLAAVAGRLGGFAGGAGGAGVPRAGDVAVSLAGRARLRYRGVVVGREPGVLAAGLGELAAGPGGVLLPGGPGGLPAGAAGPVVVRGVADVSGGVVFVFPGQGGQWAGMAAGLARSGGVFAGRLGECAAAAAPFADFDLAGVLAGGDAGGVGLERADVVQLSLWAVMVSLAAVWESLGIVPGAVLGHSQGEVAAACVAGGLSLADGARIIATRARLAGSLAAGGAMASVGVSAGRAAELIAGYGGQLSIAAVNGPGQTVLSGDGAAIEAVLAECAAAGIQVRRTPVDYASHSPLVDPVREELLAGLAGIRPRPGRVRLFSTVRAGWADTAELDAAYWWANLRSPVRFAESVAALAGQGYRAFIEASPHPLLTLPVSEQLEACCGEPCLVTGTLRRGQGGEDQVLASAAAAWTRGLPVDFSSVHPAGARPVELPTYAFQRRRFWLTLLRGMRRGWGWPARGIRCWARWRSWRTARCW